MLNARIENPVAAGQAELLSLHGIVKEFGAVRALDGISFDLKAGEVHVLLGENGAGKSTLINIMAGALQPTHGRIDVKGKRVDLASSQHGRGLGISVVYQEFSLVGSMTVAENLFLGAEESRFGFLASRRMTERARVFLGELGFDIDPAALVSDLTRGRQQMVEIGKALIANPSVLILDEPTASLTEAESEQLFGFIERLKQQGVGMVYISHRMKEVRRLADRITVLRDGRCIATVPNQGISDDELIAMMSGRPLAEIYPPKIFDRGLPVLKLSGVSTTRRTVTGASIEVAAGEIAGIAGLVGCGKSELGRLLFGLEAVQQGEIELGGSAFVPVSPRQSLDAGVIYFPSDRGAEGLALDRKAIENASLTAIATSAFARLGMIRQQQERQETGRILEALRLKPMSLFRPARSYSGGNKQKIVLARAFTRKGALFIFDEPTVGIDIPAKVEIYATIAKLAAAGAAVIVISSELSEIIGLSHKVYVMRAGCITCELSGDDISEENILKSFF